jgi:hypothetical protein
MAPKLPKIYGFGELPSMGTITEIILQSIQKLSTERLRTRYKADWLTVKTLIWQRRHERLTGNTGLKTLSLN